MNFNKNIKEQIVLSTIFSYINLIVEDLNQVIYNATAGYYFVNIVADSGFFNVTQFTLKNVVSTGDEYEADDNLSKR